VDETGWARQGAFVDELGRVVGARGVHPILTALSPVGLPRARSAILAFSSTALLGFGKDVPGGMSGESMEDVASRKRMLPG
jgi:hypothetical protein